MVNWALPEEMALYGLPKHEWRGPRWLQLIDEGEAGRGGLVLLDHGPDPWLYTRDDRWVSVGTSNDSDPDGAAELARFALVMLVGSSDTPHFSPAPDAFAQTMWVLRNRVAPVAASFDSWERATWFIDGESRAARVTQFAGVHVGVVIVEPGSLVSVLGCAFEIDGLRLESQLDSTQYHFDRGKPLTDEACDRSRRAAFGSPKIRSGPPANFARHADLATSRDPS